MPKPEMLRALIAIVGANWCLDTPAHLMAYSYDATLLYQHLSMGRSSSRAVRC